MRLGSAKIKLCAPARGRTVVGHGVVYTPTEGYLAYALYFIVGMIVSSEILARNFLSLPVLWRVHLVGRIVTVLHTEYLY